MSKETIYRGTNLNPEHDLAWEQLANRAGMNKNRFLRWLLVTLRPSDIDELMRR